MGDYAFSTCSNLSSVKFNEELKTLGESAFWGCANLINLTFPKSMQTIGVYAFSGCSGLNSIEFSEGLKNIELGGFWGCSSLTNIALPESMEKVADYAFYGCTDLISADLGDGFLEVGDNVFESCTALKDVRVGNNVQSFGSEVFTYKDAYDQTQQLDMNYYDGGDQMKYVGNEQNHFVVAVKAENTITNYTAKSGTRVIAGHAFSGITYAGCDSLTEVDLNNVVTISRYGLAYCNNLETVHFGENLKTIKERAFCLDSKIKKVYAPSLEQWMKIYYDFSNVADQEVQYQSDSNPIYYGAELYINNQPLTNLEVPESISEIFSCTFAGYKKLESIKIHKDVKKINDFAFFECSEVNTIEVDSQNSIYKSEENCLIEKSSGTLLLGCKGSSIPNGVKHIGPFAFNGVVITSKEVEIPDSVLTIGRRAFCDTYLSKFTMGVNVQSIGADAFGRDGLDAQRDVYIKDLAKWFDVDFENEDANPVAWGSRIFVNGEHITNGFSEKGLVIPESVTEIKKWAFANASVHDISIHRGVTKIDPTAFAKVANLQRITLAEDNEVFRLTENKKAVLYTNEDDKNVLLMSTTGEELDFTNDDIQIIGDYAFASRGVKSIILPTTVESIGNHAFQSCNIAEITIPENVTSLGNGAFNNCYYLVSVTFKDYNNWKEIKVNGSEENATPVDFSSPSANATMFKPTESAFKKF